MSQPPKSPAFPSQEAQKIRSTRHRAPLLWILLPFMGGLAFAKTAAFALPAGWLLAAAFALTAISIFTASRHPAGMAALAAGVFLGGAAAYEINRVRLGVYDTLPPREARVTLRITHTFPAGNAKTSPPLRHDTVQLGGLARIVGAGPHLRELVGQPVYFSLALPPSLVVGENALAPVIRTAEITAVGLLTPLPRNAASDSFDGYLTSAGMNFKLTRGRVLALEKNASRTAVFYERARLRFSEILSAGLARHPKQAGALRAMVLGQKQDIDGEQTTLFLGSGTMHLFAISGLHIGAIAAGIQILLLIMRLPRWLRVAAGALALYLYVQITGATPSAMRAFVMISILQTAFLLRLPTNALATLVFAALVTLLAAPMQLFSASFQMSYGIVAALLLYGLPLGETWLARWTLFRDTPARARTRLQRALATAQHYLVPVVAISVAASLVSAICGTIYFKLFTPGAILANLLLIPAAMFVIFAGFLSILSGLAGLTPLSILFNHAAATLLLIMETGLRHFLKIPLVSNPAQFAPAWHGYAALALLLAAMLFGYARKWARNTGGYWPPVALVAAAIILCMQFA